MLALIIGTLLYPKYYIGAISASLYFTFTLIGFITPYGQNYFWRIIGLGDDSFKIALTIILMIGGAFYLMWANFKLSEPLGVQGVSYIPLILFFLYHLYGQDSYEISLSLLILVLQIALIIPLFGSIVAMGFFVLVLVQYEGQNTIIYGNQEAFMMLALLLTIYTALYILTLPRWGFISLIQITCYMFPLVLLITWLWRVYFPTQFIITCAILTGATFISFKFDVLSFLTIYYKKMKTKKFGKYRLSRLQFREKCITLFNTIFTKSQKESPPDEEKQLNKSFIKLRKILIILNNFRPNIRLGKLLYLIMVVPAVGMFIILSDVWQVFPWFISFHEINRAAIYYPEFLPITIFLVAGIIFFFYFVFTAPIYIWRAKKRLKKEEY